MNSLDVVANLAVIDISSSLSRALCERRAGSPAFGNLIDQALAPSERRAFAQVAAVSQGLSLNRS